MTLILDICIAVIYLSALFDAILMIGVTCSIQHSLSDNGLELAYILQA